MFHGDRTCVWEDPERFWVMVATVTQHCQRYYHWAQAPRTPLSPRSPVRLLHSCQAPGGPGRDWGVGVQRDKGGKQRHRKRSGLGHPTRQRPPPPVPPRVSAAQTPAGPRRRPHSPPRPPAARRPDPPAPPASPPPDLAPPPQAINIWAREPGRSAFPAGGRAGGVGDRAVQAGLAGGLPSVARPWDPHIPCARGRGRALREGPRSPTAKHLEPCGGGGWADPPAGRPR